VKTRREELIRRWQQREGLVGLGSLTQAEAFDAVKRSLPRVRDAIRFFEQLELCLGERAARDAWAAPGERCLLVRDPEHPGWFLPGRVAYLRVDLPPEPTIDWSHIDVPEWAKAPEPPEPEERDEPVPLDPGGRSARLILSEGEASITITYDERGVWKEWMVSSGDLHTFLAGGDEGFRLDPYVRPAQVPPHSLLTRPDLRPGGHGADELARMVSELPPPTFDLGRCLVPVVQPGTVTGAWFRGLWTLRRLEWAQALPDASGWLVVDAWSGAAVATGVTFEAAAAAWHDQVRRVQPLPPFEPPAELPEPAEPTTDATFDEEKRQVTASFSMQIVMLPPVQLPWPEPRPGNVPAIAVPLPPSPSVPAALQAVGFTRVLRFFGEHGDVGFGFLREEPFGFTLVGDSAVEMVDLATLDADLQRVEEEEQREALEVWGAISAFQQVGRDPKYPIRSTFYRVRDDTGRYPDLRVGSTSWTAEVNGQWGIEQRDGILRVRHQTPTS